MKLCIIFLTVIVFGQSLILTESINKIYSSIAIAASVDTVWSHVRDFKKLVRVGLQDPNFDGITWYPGSSVKTIPGKFNITIAGGTLTEEVYSRDEIEHRLSYRIVEPGLGFVFYQSTLSLKPITFCGHPATFLERTVEFKLVPGMPADSFNSLFESELLGFEVKFGTLHCTQNNQNGGNSNESND